VHFLHVIHQFNVLIICLTSFIPASAFIAVNVGAESYSQVTTGNTPAPSSVVSRNKFEMPSMDFYMDEFGPGAVPECGSFDFDEVDEEQPSSSSAEQIDEPELSPNRPHQALEYPPLYFNQLVENMKHYYMYRYLSLQEHVPCSDALRNKH